MTNDSEKIKGKNNLARGNYHLHNYSINSSTIPAKVKAIPSYFNYGVLETQKADELKAATEKIRTYFYSGTDNFIQAGSYLCKMKEVIEYGQWQLWVQQEFVDGRW